MGGAAAYSAAPPNRAGMHGQSCATGPVAIIAVGLKVGTLSDRPSWSVWCQLRTCQADEQFLLPMQHRSTVPARAPCGTERRRYSSVELQAERRHARYNDVAYRGQAFGIDRELNQLRSSNSSLASFRSGTSKPSVNRP